MLASGNIWTILEYHTDDRWRAADIFMSRHGELPEYVTKGRHEYVIIGACEVCGSAIFDDEEYEEDSECVRWHKRHNNEDNKT